MIKEENNPAGKVADYIEELQLTGHSRKSCQDTKSCLSRYLEYLQEKNLEFIDVGLKEAQAYQGWLLMYKCRTGGLYSRVAITRRITEATKFHTYLKREGIACMNPFKEILRVRDEHHLPKNIFKEKEMNDFLIELETYDKAPGLMKKIKHYRVHVIAELMYSTGMRIGEVAALKPRDINFERGTVEVRFSKNGSGRICFLNDYAKEVLRLYVEEMRDWLFSSYHFKNGSLFGVGAGRLDLIVNSVLSEVRVRNEYRKIVSHGFRHALGAHFLKSGCDIRYIQSILGHRTLKSTQLYTEIEKGDLRDVLDKYHPRKWREKE